MNSILSIYRKEVASFFNSLIAYVVIGVFLIGVGLFFWVFEGNVLETREASMQLLFDAAPYFFLFLVPAITMRAFAEEIKTGTIEFLATKPITDWHIILGKYLAAVFLVVFALIPTIIYYFSLSSLGNPPGNLDTGAIIGSYIGLFFLGSIYAAIGLFTSALSENQIIAYILGLFLCFFFFQAFDLFDGFTSIGILSHYESISRGVVDTRDILYFLTFIGIALKETQMMLGRRMK